MPPIIGITTYGPAEHRFATAHYDHHTLVPTQYIESVQRAGGLPVLLPVDRDTFPGVLDRLDGVIFTGGGDIDPSRYGGNSAHPDLTERDPDRDQSELQGIRAALARADLPIMCICRGLQVLNVALGGSLTEHIPDLGIGDIHRGGDGNWTLHPVTAEPGSRLAEAMGARTVRTTSGHHQAVRAIAEGLTVTARAPDGVIEGLEADNHPWCVAVQWHPEVTTGEDPTQQRLFDTLVARAGG